MSLPAPALLQPQNAMHQRWPSAQAVKDVVMVMVNTLTCPHSCSGRGKGKEVRTQAQQRQGVTRGGARR